MKIGIISSHRFRRGIHYYGSLRIHNTTPQEERKLPYWHPDHFPGVVVRIEIKHKLESIEEIEKLFPGEASDYEVGESTRRFMSLEDLLAEGTTLANELRVTALYLFHDQEFDSKIY